MGGQVEQLASLISWQADDPTSECQDDLLRTRHDFAGYDLRDDGRSLISASARSSSSRSPDSWTSTKMEENFNSCSQHNLIRSEHHDRKSAIQTSGLPRLRTGMELQVKSATAVRVFRALTRGRVAAVIHAAALWSSFGGIAQLWSPSLGLRTSNSHF